MSTGSPSFDAREDWDRARRQAQYARLGARLRGRARDLDVMLPFDEVVAALGRRGERHRGVHDIPVDAVIGSVDRQREFDRRFRPTTPQSRTRFERLAAAARRGEEVPPIDVYQVGEAYFVVDGHHRVAVARALGWPAIAARVTEVLTVVGADRHLTLADLPLKGHERLFRERVPLRPELAVQLAVRDPDDYGELAEAVEAWAFRVAQQEARETGSRLLPTREEVAERWWVEEYQPTLSVLREAGLLPTGERAERRETETEAYLRLSALRYRLLRRHRWDEDTVERLRAALS